MTFPLEDPTKHVFVSSRDRDGPQASTDSIGRRALGDTLYLDCMHIKMPDEYLEVTVVVESREL